jgi:hypothetical protein
MSTAVSTLYANLSEANNYSYQSFLRMFSTRNPLGRFQICEISGSYGGGYEDDSLLGYTAV